MTIKYGPTRRISRAADDHEQIFVCSLDGKEVCRLIAPASVSRRRLTDICDQVADLVQGAVK